MIARTLTPLATAIALTGCMATPTSVEPQRTMSVVRVIEIATEDEGVSEGFNLDGVVSTSIDAAGCNQPDMTSPDGEPGIDNQFSAVLPVLDLAGEGALAAFIQNAIDEGRLLVMPEVVDYGDSMTLTVYRGEDQPLVGTDGKLLENQTLALHPDRTVLGETEEVALNGRRLSAGPFELDLPVVVFELLYDVHLRNAQLQIEFDEDGHGKGVVAGTALVTNLKDLAKTAGERADLDILGLAGTFLDDIADMEPDPRGTCRGVSLVATLETVPAYTYDSLR